MVSLDGKVYTPTFLSNQTMGNYIFLITKQWEITFFSFFSFRYDSILSPFTPNKQDNEYIIGEGAIKASIYTL